MEYKADLNNGSKSLARKESENFNELKDWIEKELRDFQEKDFEKVNIEVERKI